MRNGVSGHRVAACGHRESVHLPIHNALLYKQKKEKLTATVSVGIASYPDDGSATNEVISKANDAVYRAKATGRNKVGLSREAKMVTKTSHYTQGQLNRLSQLGKKQGVGDAVLLREALEDLLRKYNEPESGN